MEDDYKDIINIKHFEPKYHKRMSRYNRAAQFAPFSALTGYSDKIKDVSIIDEKKVELSEEEIQIINLNLIKLNDIIKLKPSIKLTYFDYDEKLKKGKYITKQGILDKIDMINYFIKFDNKKINIEDIYRIYIN